MPATAPASKAATIAKADLESLWETASIRLTDKIRALALGVVAFSWVLMSADKPPIANIYRLHPLWLVGTALLAILSLLFDLLQSLGNYWQFDRLLVRMEREGQTTGAFDPRSFFYRGQNWALALKVAICLGSCLSLLILLAVSLLSPGGVGAL
jgi:hypothetical protein